MSGRSSRSSSLCGSRALFVAAAPPVPQRKESLPTPVLIPQFRHFRSNSIVPLASSTPLPRKARVTAGSEVGSTEIDKTSVDSSSMDHTALTEVPVPINRTQVFEAKNLYNESFRVLHEFYQSGQLCDVELVVGNRCIKCHRVVLACVSRYFRYFPFTSYSVTKILF